MESDEKMNDEELPPKNTSRSRRLGFGTQLLLLLALAFGCLVLTSGCHSQVETLEVTATAFNSLAAQTDSNPTFTAWGVELEPGMKAVAISRDLIDQGLGHGTWIRIDGLPGKYQVVDKMNRRYKKRIDIYMGHDKMAARHWGKKTVTISWPHD